MSIRILSTSDIHLGKSSANIPDNAAEKSTKIAWNRIVDYTIEKNIDILLLSGDIVDRENMYYEAIGSLKTGFRKLNDESIAVYIVAGNHDFDVLPKLVNDLNYENVHLLGSQGEWEIKSFSKGGQKVQFIGWSFPKQYYREDPLSNFNMDNIDPNFPCIGLLHGDVGSNDSNYAPINLNNLKNKSINAWILGHIHKPQKLNDKPLIWYPGSPQAMNAKETGTHGPLLLTIEDNEVKASHILLSPIRYENLKVYIDELDDQDKINDKITSKIFSYTNDINHELELATHLICDIELHGNHPKINDVELWANNGINDFVYDLESGTRTSVRKITNNIFPIVDNLEELAKEISPVGLLAESILAMQNNNSTPFLDDLIENWNKQTEDLNNTGTYKDLRSAKKVSEINDEEAKVKILQECNRLLGHLLAQIEK